MALDTGLGLIEPLQSGHVEQEIRVDKSIGGRDSGVMTAQAMTQPRTNRRASAHIRRQNCQYKNPLARCSPSTPATANIAISAGPIGSGRYPSVSIARWASLHLTPLRQVPAPESRGRVDRVPELQRVRQRRHNHEQQAKQNRYGDEL